MHISAGTFLKSSSTLNDATFDEVVIFITEYNKSGATGFIINKEYHRVFNELTEYSQSIPFIIYSGGPVNADQLYFMHKRADLVDGGIPIVDKIYLGGNFKQAVEHINNVTTAQNDIKLFIGYCGWDPGQLEAEIEEGTWVISTETDELFFKEDDK